MQNNQRSTNSGSNGTEVEYSADVDIIGTNKISPNTKSTNVPLILTILSIVAVPLNYIILAVTGKLISGNIVLGFIALIPFLSPLPLAITALVVNRNNTKFHKLTVILAIIEIILYSLLLGMLIAFMLLIRTWVGTGG
ncbi:MAG: hypothetical protein U0516_00485 [Candidatus Saccharibacteria bacterium]